MSGNIWDVRLGSKNTNCITSMPQDINIEYNPEDFTFTVKTGSKLFYGTSSISSSSSITNDTNSKNAAILGSINNGEKVFICYNSTASNLILIPENKIVENDTFSLIGTTFSLPLGTYWALDSTGAVSNINQIFNGFGYYGRNIFITPGIKYLIPNGYTPSSSYNSITRETSNGQITTITSLANILSGTNVWLINDAKLSESNYVFGDDVIGLQWFGRGYFYALLGKATDNNYYIKMLVQNQKKYENSKTKGHYFLIEISKDKVKGTKNIGIDGEPVFTPWVRATVRVKSVFDYNNETDVPIPPSSTSTNAIESQSQIIE